MDRLPFLANPRLRMVLMALEGGGHEALVVGGAARDGLMGQDPHDIDVATDAHPDKVAVILGQAGASMRPTGLDHGTWTAVVENEGFEVTTYRKDVSTDGRRATVAFASSFAEDAQRRDFTINALGVDARGKVYDPTGQGMDDLAARRVRFVGDGATRCAEDALRALRLFRFQARMGSWPMDGDALSAAAGADLKPLSGERIWSEVKGILVAKEGVRAVGAMVESGVWGTILPGPTSMDNLRRVEDREHDAGLSPSWPARLHALTGHSHLPWPVASEEARRLLALTKLVGFAGRPLAGAAAAGKAEVGADLWRVGTTAVPAEGVEVVAARGAAARMPVVSADLAAMGTQPGPLMGQQMERMRQAWLASDLAHGKGDLLAVLGTPTPPRQQAAASR
jgi:poly(A) polymerase